MSSSSASTVRPTGAGPSRSRPGPARGRSTSSKSSASSRSSRAARPWRGVRAGTSLCRADPKQALAHEPPDQHETAVHVERAGKIGRGERLVHVEDAPDGFGGMGGKHDLLAVEGEHEGAVRLGQGHDRRPALELGLRVDILERAQLRELAVPDRAPGPRELLASAPLDGVARELPMEKTNEIVRVAPLDRPPEAELVGALVERRAKGIEPGDDVDADREVQRVARRQLLPGLDEPKGGVAQTARGDDVLQLLFGEKVVVAPRLVSLNDERPALPVVGEELGLACRLDA